MNELTTPPGEIPVQRFHYSAKTKQKSLLITLITLPFYALISCALIGMIALPFMLVTDDLAGAAMRGLLIGAACVVAPFLLLPLVLTAISIRGLFVSYLEAGPAGITYDYWGQFRSFTRWEDMDRIGQHNPLVKEALMAHRQDIHEPLLYRWRQAIFKKGYPIPLEQFDGWPDGELAAAIRRYAPRLFEERDHGSERSGQTG